MQQRSFSAVSCYMFVLSVSVFLITFGNIKADGADVDMSKWVPPTATDWVSLENKMVASYYKIKESSKDLKPGVIRAPMVSLDRTDGTLYAFPQSGALWVSKDNGQTFEWLNHEIGSWGFNESPSSLHVSPDGKKMRIFSSNKSGYSFDAGKTWKYMNFKIAFGFEDGHINWHGDSKMIIARSHTWPKPRMWLSRDGGESFIEYSTNITAKINTQSMALMKDDVMLFQGPKGLVRTEDYGKTVQDVTAITAGAYAGKGQFIGVSRQFKGKVYWLNNTGVYTSSDKGKTWALVGKNFPAEWANKRGFIRSGPMFGKDEKQMVVMCEDKFVETLDGGNSWHVLADAPLHFHGNPWSFSFSYNPIDDILYCNSRGHGGGPYLFGRLALKRWGSTEKIAPTVPADIKSEILPSGNQVKISWKDSQDSSGVIWYRISVDGELKYYSETNSIVLHDLGYEQSVKIGVQSVDYWQNMSKMVELSVKSGAEPANTVKLMDLPWASAKTAKGDLEIMKKIDTRGKKDKPIQIMINAFKLNPIKGHIGCKATNEIGLHVERGMKYGELTYKLDKKYKRLSVGVGLPYGDWYTAEFSITVDGKKVEKIKMDGYGAHTRMLGRPIESFDVDLTDADSITFKLDVKNPRYFYGSLVVLNNGVLFMK